MHYQFSYYEWNAKQCIFTLTFNLTENEILKVLLDVDLEKKEVSFLKKRLLLT